MNAARYPDGAERRAAVELRTVAGRKLVGYASVFDSPARIGSGFTEIVRRGAYAATLAKGADVLCLAEHDPARLLGRTASGTLKLAEDSRGLHFEVSLPETTLGADILALAERGDIGGASVGFRVPPGGDTWPAPDRRELVAVDLLEVSIISAWPAFNQTVVSARARQLGQAEASARLRRLLAEVL